MASPKTRASASRSPATVLVEPDAVAATFATLLSSWQTRRPQHSSFQSDQTGIPEYRAIVGLGIAAIPYLLEELRKKSGPWAAALREITGENPAPPSAAGRYDVIAKAWIDWERARGYVVG